MMAGGGRAGTGLDVGVASSFKLYDDCDNTNCETNRRIPEPSNLRIDAGLSTSMKFTARKLES
jgi:hypothetical protein